MELELDAEFQAHRTSSDPVRYDGRLYPAARTFFFPDGSTLSVVDDGEDGFVVVSDGTAKTVPIGSRLH